MCVCVSELKLVKYVSVPMIYSVVKKLTDSFSDVGCEAPFSEKRRKEIK